MDLENQQSIDKKRMSLITRDMMLHAYSEWKRTALPDDTIIFFNARECERVGGIGLCAMNLQEMETQKKQWRKLAQDKKIKIQKFNNKTYKHEDGNTWHFLVVQPTNLDDCNMDPMGIFIMGEMVSGFIYAFKHKKHRDTVQKFVMNGLPVEE